MKEKKVNRSKLLQLRLTPAEMQVITNECSHSTCRKLSEYVRKKLMGKPIFVYHRNQSLDDFMTVMISLKNELNAICSNYNQVVKRLHGLQHFEEIKTWLLLNESARKILLKKVDEIKLKIHQINDQWLQ